MQARRPRLSRLVSFIPLLLVACASYGRPMPEIAGEINATLTTGATLVAPGDLLELRLPDSTDPIEIPVRPDGRATFPYVGEVHVAGLTMQQLQEDLRRQLAPKLTASEGASVNIKTLAARSAIVMGEVETPGVVELPSGRLTLLQALGAAGGPLKRSAMLEYTLLVRWMPQQGKQVAWRVDAAVDHWTSPTPIWLQPYDVVFVPNHPIDNVNIWVDQYIRQMLPLPYLPIPTGT